MNLKLKPQFVARMIDDDLMIINKYEANEIHQLTSIYKFIILSIINHNLHKTTKNKIKNQYNLNSNNLSQYITDLIDLKIVEVNNE